MNNNKEKEEQNKVTIVVEDELLGKFRQHIEDKYDVKELFPPSFRRLLRKSYKERVSGDE